MYIKIKIEIKSIIFTIIIEIMSQMTKTLVIDNNVHYEHLDTIADFFEKYKLGKPLSINYNEEQKCAVLKLDFWYDNVCANNMYDRIVETGESRIVYNDPEYFTVRFYNDEQEGVDYRDEYIANENRIQDEVSVDYREDYIENENRVDIEYEDDSKPSELENPYYGGENDSSIYREEIESEDEVDENISDDDDYLEDDVIENSNNIDRLFELVVELTKKIKSIDRRLGNITKKTNVLYKSHPIVIKRSVWEGRLRSR